MGKKKRKYWVDIPEARKFLFNAYGMKSKEKQFYELWIVPIGYQVIFHWYHTQGTLVMKYKQKGKILHKSVAECGDVESCAESIKKELARRPHFETPVNAYAVWKEGLNNLYKVIHNSEA